MSNKTIYEQAVADGADEDAPAGMPLARVYWIPPSSLRGNDYNPNHVFGPEMDLLATSIMEDGWTQPIVARPDGEIVDGFHRWTLSRTHPGVMEASDGLCPVVFLEPSSQEAQKMSTVRHNRARGSHGIVNMGELLRSLRDAGATDEQLRAGLGMEQEEIDRLTDYTASPEKAGKENFGRGWVPVEKG
jgi:hypothetical protein